MNPAAAANLARELIATHAPPGWTFSWDRAVRRLGCCKYGTRQITMSYDLTVIAPEPEVRNMILHEIAHAVAGYDAAHGPHWVRVARSLGCTGDRCYDVAKVGRIEAKWQATCPSCSKTYHMHRIKHKHLVRWCPPCGRTRGQLLFKEV